MACDYTCNYVSVCGYTLFVLILAWGSRSCYGLRTFALDVEQRFSDPFIASLAVDRLPKKGSLQYYAAMVHHDRVLHGRRLAASTDQGPFTFFNGNQTVQISSLGLLHYANISVGTPSLSFMVALDTGSEMFWLPCHCSSCSKDWVSPSGNKINFNMYSPDKSTTSSKVPCNSNLCELQDECTAKSNQCPYNISYVSYRTSSAGLVVEDVLHLTTEDQLHQDVDARITFGCSMNQTGLFLQGGPLNGLLGLGLGNLSVPSILAKDGLTSNSFSMCFGPDGLGRINFGDKGSSDQGETPFNPEEFYPVYNISITQINVGRIGTDVNFTAIFDSGSAFTHLNDPAYTLISESFDSQAKAKHKRLPYDPTVPFQYCYEISPNQTNIATTIPTVNLTMKGGDHFVAFNATVNGGNFFCLGVLKSEDLSIVGQNFMTGYRIVFDREKMVMGWKASDCYNAEKSNNSLPINPGNTVAFPPAVAADPGATAGTPVGSPISGASPPLSNNSSRHRSLPMVLILLVEGISAALFDLSFGFSESASFSKFALFCLSAILLCSWVDVPYS